MTTTTPTKRSVNFFFIEENNDTEPAGKRVGVECDACAARFFDTLSQGARPRVLESAISKAIEHAKTAHPLSSGGRIGFPIPHRSSRL